MIMNINNLNCILITASQADMFLFVCSQAKSKLQNVKLPQSGDNPSEGDHFHHSAQFERRVGEQRVTDGHVALDGEADDDQYGAVGAKL